MRKIFAISFVLFFGILFCSAEEYELFLVTKQYKAVTYLYDAKVDFISIPLLKTSTFTFYQKGNYPQIMDEIILKELQSQQTEFDWVYTADISLGVGTLDFTQRKDATVEMKLYTKDRPTMVISYKFLGANYEWFFEVH